MLLYQSTLNPWNTTFRNAEGQVIYKTECPSTCCTSRQITIKRILPSNSIDLATASEDALRRLDLRDSFSDLAEIHYGLLSSSRIRYNGIDMATTQFFRRSGFLGRHRYFTGPDGKEYGWKMVISDCKLYLKGAPRNPVASYHARTFGIIGNAPPASLEIFPEGQHMVDLIFVTFIFLFVEEFQSGYIL